MADTYAKDQAERASEVLIFEAVEENLPDGMEEEWNWKAMATWVNARFETNFQDHQLRNMDRDEMIALLAKKSEERIEKMDLSEGAHLLESDFGLRTMCGWLRHKFGIETTPDEFRDIEDNRRVAEIVMQRAEQAYNDKELEYPVLAGISRFTSKQGAQISLDREGLVDWCRDASVSS